MKKYIAISVLAISAGVSGFLTSCEDALDADKYFDDRRTIESVFTNVDQTNGWLSQAFNYLTDDCADVITKEENAIGLTNFSVDMYYGDRDIVYDNKWGSALPSYNTFKQGDYPETYGEQFSTTPRTMPTCRIPATLMRRWPSISARRWCLPARS